MCSGRPHSWFNALLTLLKLLIIFDQGPHFHFAWSLANYVVVLPGPFSHICELKACGHRCVQESILFKSEATFQGREPFSALSIFIPQPVPQVFLEAAFKYPNVFQFSSVTQSCLTLCGPMDCSTPGFPVHHQLLELAQTHVH